MRFSSHPIHRCTTQRFYAASKRHNTDKGMLAKRSIQRIKGEKQSSSEWLRRKAGDRYTRQAHEEGMISRASFKLQQIFFKNRDIRGKVIVDLGAAPGGWTAMAQKHFPTARIIAVDMKEMTLIPNTTQLVLDFTSDEAPSVLAAALNSRKVDILLSDMAPAFCGNHSIDHLRIMELANVAFEFGLYALKPGGHFIVKINRGGSENEFKKKISYYFETTEFFKPNASFNDSSEIYIISKRYYGMGGRENPSPRIQNEADSIPQPSVTSPIEIPTQSSEESGIIELTKIGLDEIGIQKNGGTNNL